MCTHHTPTREVEATMRWAKLSKPTIPKDQAAHSCQDRQDNEVACKSFNLANLGQHPKLWQHGQGLKVAASRPHDVKEGPPVKIWVDYNSKDEATHNHVLDTEWEGIM